MKNKIIQIDSERYACVRLNLKPWMWWKQLKSHHISPVCLRVESFDYCYYSKKSEYIYYEVLGACEMRAHANTQTRIWTTHTHAEATNSYFMAIKRQQFIPATEYFFRSFSIYMSSVDDAFSCAHTHARTHAHSHSRCLTIALSLFEILLHSIHVFRIKCVERHLINWVNIQIFIPFYIRLKIVSEHFFERAMSVNSGRQNVCISGKMLSLLNLLVWCVFMWAFRYNLEPDNSFLHPTKVISKLLARAFQPKTTNSKKKELMKEKQQNM